MGYLKRFGDGKYRITYDIVPEHGKRRQRRETLKGVTKKEAQAILAAREAEVQKVRAAIANGVEPKDEIEIGELFDRFMKAKATSKEASTMARYGSLAALYLKPRFGNMKAGTLKPYTLTNVYSEWQQNGRGGRMVSPRTIRHAHELMRNVLNWGVRVELLTRNVASFVSDDDLPKSSKPRPVALTEGELRIVLNEAKNPTERSKKRGYLSSQPWFHPAMVFAAYTGARRGEVLALRWIDVNLEQRSVTIARSITEQLKFKAPKNDKSRTISMPESLVLVLRAHRHAQLRERLALGAVYNDMDLVFAHADGSPVDPWNFGRAALDCIKRAGVTPITLHGLRDTHASLLARAGVPIEVISHRLGHGSIGVTVERYLHIYSDRDVNAADAFEKLVG